MQNLSIGYKNNTQVLEIKKNIDFNLSAGHIAAIVGANGSGKSTLLRTLANVQPKLHGSVLLNNKEISQYNPLELASQLSLVLTEQLPSKNLTVSEIVALGRQPYTNWIGTLSKKDIAKIKEALLLVDIEDIQNKKCYEISDGQLQKVMIARALAQDTSLIILDEPTTHLDIYHKAYVLKLLKKIASETNKTILFSTHEIDLAIQLSDKMLIMNNKDAVFGNPCELIEKDGFSNLFPDNLVNFDAQTGTFRII